MSQFPFQLDSDLDLPRVDSNLTEIGSDAINALRSAMFAVENNLGIGIAGSAQSLAARLNVSLNPDGSIQSSVLIGLLSLVSITDVQVSPTANIQESKLNLHYSTSSLYDLYVTLKSSVDILNGWLSLVGVKVEPHIDGTDYHHLLSAIDVDASPSILKTFPSTGPTVGTNVVNRNNSNADLLIKDLSDDLVIHEKADGSAGVSVASGGTVPPLNYGHMAAGVYVNPSSFLSIPQSNNDVQKVIDYIDNSSLLLIGSRVQNFYSNGISLTSRSSSLLADGYGEPIVPPTPATAYFLGVPPGPPSTSPVDDFADGDDVILFNPTFSQLSTFNFDAQFSIVNPGDLITINYGTGIFYQFVIDSTKKIVSGTTRTYAVRINGKNPVSNVNAFARIDRATFHRNKYGVLATTRTPNIIGVYESITTVNPRSAIALGNGFSPSEFDHTHYNLYLTLLPNGDTSNIYTLPAIDVTGNQGQTPGAYTIDSVVNSINTTFRSPGYNFRLLAFEYNGQVGIASDPYNNASFSIISGVVDSTTGNYTSTSNASYPNNVVDNFNSIDPLGFGLTGSNIASPPPGSYASVAAAEFAPTILFYPLKRNYFYTDGVERDRLKSDPLIIDNLQDKNGDGYWPATISQIVSGSTVQITYLVNLDLSDSGLAIGKTIVVQPMSPTNSTADNVNYGRFIISNIQFTNCPGPTGITNITVYDAVHGIGLSPHSVFPVNTIVGIYFSDDSVSFDVENVYDGSSLAGFGNTANLPYKRFFEIYVDGNGHTDTHERARFSINSSLYSSNVSLFSINFYNISPKLRGYTSIGNDKEIRLVINSFVQATGKYVGQLGRWNSNSSTFTNLGPLINGRQGEIVRFYDETNIDYIDFIFDINTSVPDFSNKFIDIQLFKSLSLDQQFMLIGTCQLNDTLKSISYLKDKRQFGNISEEQLSTSALDFINSNARHTMQNGVIRGFDLISSASSTTSNIASFSGGLALTNGKLNAINAFSIEIPLTQDNNGGAPVPGIIWAVCANDQGEIVLIPLTDYEPAVSSINNPGRLLQLFNVVSSNTYYVDSTTFTTLIESRKDLTVLWIAYSAVVNSTTFVLSIVDARKYASDVNANNYMVITSDNSQGNFKSFAAINVWAKYNSAIQNTVILRGNFTFNIDSGFPSNVVYEGDGYLSSIILNTQITLQSNTTLKNCNIIVNSNTGFAIAGSANNINFINCNFTYNSVPSGGYTGSNLINSIAGCIYSSAISLLNISIRDCTFTCATSTRFPFISVEFNTDTSIAQSIYIQRNRFYTIGGISDLRFSGDDLSAAIAFTSKISSIPNLEGMKLIDCIIEENLCNKNQMIAISALSVASVVKNALTPVATRIINNTCGTIAVIGCSDSPRNFNTQTTNFSYDENSGVIVSGNTCRYIASLESTGKLIAQGTINFTANSSNITIEKNNVSWISLMANNSTGAIKANQNNGSDILIIGNKCRAFNSAFLSNFGTQALNNAIYLSKGTSSATVPRTIIRDNTFLSGLNLTSTVSNIMYEYGQNDSSFIESNLESIIDGNIFDGNLTANDFFMVEVASTAPCSITNNKFYRNGIAVPAYINLTDGRTFSTPGIVTNNFFDSNTVDDATNKVLVIADPICIVSQNKNQTGYAEIPMQFEFISTVYPFIGINTGGPPNLVGSDGYFNLSSGTTLNQAMYFNLDKYLPVGVQVLHLVQGYTCNTGTASVFIPGNAFAISLSVEKPANFTYTASLNGTLADVHNTFTLGSNTFTAAYPSILSITGGNVGALCSSTVYNKLDVSSFSLQVGITPLNVAITLDMKATVATNTTAIIVSPLLVEYQW